MRQSCKSICFIMLFIWTGLSVPAHDQNQTVKKSTRQSDIKKGSSQKPVSANRQAAVILLKQLVTQTNSFPKGAHQSFKIILFQAEVADTLWDYDEPHARSLFADAFKATAAFQRTTPSALATNESLILRVNILRFILSHDVNLAANLVDSIAVDAATPAPITPFSAAFKEQAALYLEIANTIATSDPQEAARLIKKTMNGWMGDGQIQALQSLRRSSPELADELFLSLLATFKSRPTYITAKAGILARYIFPDSEQSENSNDIAAGSAGTSPVSPALIHSFLDFVYDHLMQQPFETHINEPNEFGRSAFAQFAMEDLAPYFDRYMPEKAHLYRAYVEDISNKVKQAGKQDLFASEDEAWRDMFAMDVEERLKKAEATKDMRLKEQGYSEAAFVLAVRDKQFDRAFTIVAKITDNSAKAEVLSMILERAIIQAFKDQDAEKAYGYAKDMKKPWEFVRYSTYIAALLITQKKFERAGQILKAAEKVIPDTGDSDPAALKVEVANVAANLQPEWGFTAMKAAIDAINQVNLPDFSSDGFGNGPDNKIIFSNRFSYAPGFGILGRTDFARALRLAKSLQSKELSLLAQLAICQGILRRSVEN
jgi:hypothetical protein